MNHLYKEKASSASSKFGPYLLPLYIKTSCCFLNWILVGSRRHKNKKKIAFLQTLLKMPQIKNKSSFKQKEKSKEDKNRKDVMDKLIYHAPKLIEKASNKIDQFVK